MTNKKTKRRRKSNDGKHFESKTHQILKKFNTNKQVLADVRIVGKLSESSRQLDVTLRDPNEFDFIAYECKDEKASIGTPTVEGYYTKLMDVGAKHGAIVSNSSFTRGARRMAEKLGIELLHIIDTDDEAIKTKINAPSGVVKEKVLTWDVLFKERITEETPLGTPEFASCVFLQSDGSTQLTLKEMANNFWEEVGSRTTKGIEEKEYKNIKLLYSGKAINLPDMIIRLHIEFEYRVGVMDISRSVGIFNIQDSSYQTDSMAVGPFGEEIFNTWRKVSRKDLEAMVLTSILHTRTDLRAEV